MTNQTVFVVDEDVDCCSAIAEILENEGWRPQSFRSAHEMLAGLADGSPALVVTDLAMPGARGAEILASVRGDERWGGIPIIVFTGWSDTEGAARLGIPVVFKPDVAGLMTLVGSIRPS